MKIFESGKERAINTFAKMIERMEDLVLAGLGIPLTPWTIVNGDKLVPLLDRIRESLPEEVRQSQMIIDRRDEILAESQRKGTEMLEDAKIQAETMLSESELMKAVQEEAERIRHQVMVELDAHRKKAFEEAEAMKAAAYEESRAVREGADRYAETVLASLEKSLSEFQMVVRNGQKHLKHSRSQASQMVSPLVGGVRHGAGQPPRQPQHPGRPVRQEPPSYGPQQPPRGYQRVSQEYLPYEDQLQI